MTKGNAGLGVIVLVLIVALIFSPFLTIWALNTLFGLKIAFTLSTWFAVVWLQALAVVKVSK